MKYLLILILMSGYVNADIENEIKPANALAESNILIEKLTDRIERMQEQAEVDVSQATQLRGFLVRITTNCMSGKDFVSIDEANNIHRFHCMKEIK